MATKRAVILAGTFLDLLDRHIPRMKEAGLEVLADPAWKQLRSDELVDLLPGVHVAFLPAACGLARQHIDAADSLLVASVCASGYEWLDVAAATRAGVVVTYAPTAEGAQPVADLTFGLMLAVARQIPLHHLSVRQGQDRRGFGDLLYGKTLGIVGFGQIGQAVAARARGFNMTVLAYEPVSPSPEVAARYDVAMVELDELLSESHFVSLHLRLNQQTLGIIGAREVSLMRPGSYLINTARRALVDEEALHEALVSGHLAGAGLDVAADGPGDPHKLIFLDNVVCTPHLGNRCRESANAVIDHAIDSAVAVLAGRRPPYVANPEVYDTEQFRCRPVKHPSGQEPEANR